MNLSYKLQFIELEWLIDKYKNIYKKATQNKINMLQ